MTRRWTWWQCFWADHFLLDQYLLCTCGAHAAGSGFTCLRRLSAVGCGSRSRCLRQQLLRPHVVRPPPSFSLICNNISAAIRFPVTERGGRSRRLYNELSSYEDWLETSTGPTHAALL